MTQLLKKAPAYQEKFIPGKHEPQAVLARLLHYGVITTYVLYEGNGEVRIAGNVLARLTLGGSQVVWECQGRATSEVATDPFKQVEAIFETLPFAEWCAYGYIGFDVAGYYSAYSRSISQPLLWLVVPETELRLTSEGIFLRTVLAPELVESALAEEVPMPEYRATPPTVDHADRDRYQGQVRTLTEAIRSGKLQKAILSRSVKLRGDLDVPGTYALGSSVNNSVRSYALDLGPVRAVGFSPEILMQVDGEGIVVTNPLAGTRPRAESPEEDARLNGELFTDAKEVKEHALSIWLAQSEIASVCREGTERIYDFMQVKQYRTVQHLSSRVGGKLAADRTLWDALRVLFPGITVSGIDKDRALEWIDRLESEPRGIYAGAIGWVDSAGRADLAIAIRSVYQYGDTVCLNAGAGIVAESVPELEYMESVHKMNTMLTQVVLHPRP